MEIIHFDSLSSTNSKLLELSKKNAKSWTVVSTFQQTAGKGYSGNQWISEPNKNIAVSVLIKSDLKYNQLIYFNQWLCNTVAAYLKRFSQDVYVKWPNDIIIANKKVGGILIETHKSDNQLNIISGIGLNINQSNFDLLPKAGSLITQTGQEYDLNEILSDLLTDLKNSFQQIENRDWGEIFSVYNENLFRIHQLSDFRKNGENFKAIIKGVDESGQLILSNSEGEITKYPHKSIEMIY